MPAAMLATCLNHAVVLRLSSRDSHALPTRIPLSPAACRRERERRRWEQEEKARAEQERLEYERRQAHKEAVLGLTAETEAGREKAQEQKQARDAALAAKRQRLKAVFLQQQIAKAAALAASKGGKGGGKGGGGGAAKDGS